MPPEKTRRRRSSGSSPSRAVKTSITVDADLLARWRAAAAISGQTANAFAIEALGRSLKGFYLVDRREAEAPADGVGKAPSTRE